MSNRIISDYASVSINLETLAEELSFGYYYGENTNQDPCFVDGEDGFENGLYDENKQMVFAYMVILTLGKKKKNAFSKKYNLCVEINFSGSDFAEDYGEVSAKKMESEVFKFSLEQPLFEVRDEILRRVRKKIDLFDNIVFKGIK